MARPNGALPGAILAALRVAAIMFIWVAWHEFSYARTHPYAYGPANVIGVAGVAGVILALCLIAVVLSTSRSEEQRSP